jgi:hypothetical protein
MAQQTINNNSVQPIGLPNTGIGTDEGDTWNAAVTKLNAMFNDLYGSSSAIAAANRRGSVTQLSTNVSAFTSAATNTSQTAMSYSIPASTLSTAGSGVWIETWGNVANNAAPKSIALNVGGKTLSTGTFTSAAVSWSLDAFYMLTAANAETWLAEGWAGTTRVASNAGTDTATSTSAINVTVVTTDASAATGNVLVNGLTIQFMP